MGAEQSKGLKAITNQKASSTIEKPSPHTRKPGPVDAEALATRLSALVPKPTRRTDNWPASSDALSYRPASLPSHPLPARIDIRSLSHTERKALATGPPITVLVGLDRIPVIRNVPANAMAVGSRIAQSQLYYGGTVEKPLTWAWFTDCDPKSVQSLCHFIKDMLLEEEVPALPKGLDRTNVYDLMKMYHAGRVMDMGSYLDNLQKVLVQELGAKGVLHSGIMTLAEKLKEEDVVFARVVEVAGKLRREGKLRLRLSSDGKRVEVAFPRLVGAMNRLNQAEGWVNPEKKTKEKKEEKEKKE
jgi:hypothetical protein